MDKRQKICKNDTKGNMVISHQKWKITFLESLMNPKYERLNSEFLMISGLMISKLNILINPCTRNNKLLSIVEARAESSGIGF